MSITQTVHALIRGCNCFLRYGQIMYNLEAWAGKRCEWRSVTCAVIRGFRPSKIRRFVPARSAGARCGTGVGWTGARKRHGVRRGGASGLQSNSRLPSLMRCSAPLGPRTQPVRVAIVQRVLCGNGRSLRNCAGDKLGTTIELWKAVELLKVSLQKLQLC